MCGIFGYIGTGDARRYIINGLKRLEYRGYDSWGVAVAVNNTIDVKKMVGAIGTFKDIESLPYSHIGIGHTRWATHGGVTENNAHPHFSSDKKFMLAQNGIVENYQNLKEMLTKEGYKFETETDTEIIVRLIEKKLKNKAYDLKEAVRSAFLDLKGRNTIILLEQSGKHMIAVKNGSPLVLGLGKDELFIASDTLSFADKTDKVVFVNNNEMIEFKNDEIGLYKIQTGGKIELKVTTLDHADTTIDKEGFKHFMIKEIVEQKHTIKEAVTYSRQELMPIIKAINAADTVYTVGAGTAGYSAAQIAFFLRSIAGIKAIELKSYEIGSYERLFSSKDLILAVSQSGETADTIEALEIAKRSGTKIASLVNMLGSTVTRMSDYPYYSRSGPEICVVSTKVFTSQLAWGYYLSYSLLGKTQGEKAKTELHTISKYLESLFTDKLFSQVKSIIEKYITKKSHLFILGKDQNYNISLEAALKMKEATYKHFEGFAAGELKHGVIALIEKGTPVFVIVSNDKFESDILSAAAEVKARGAKVIGIAKEPNELFDETIIVKDFGKADSIVNIVPFHLLSYHLSVKLGYNPDKPRNLAKSVTVK